VVAAGTEVQTALFGRLQVLTASHWESLDLPGLQWYLLAAEPKGLQQRRDAPAEWGTRSTFQA